MGGDKGWDRQIARRLITLIILVSGLLAAVATAVQLWVEYRRDVDRIAEGFPQIEASYLDSVVQNVWLVDPQRLTLLLEGITQLPDFRRAVVRDESGVVLAEAGTPPVAGAETLARSWPLWFDHRGVPLHIGTLEVTADMDAVYIRLWERVGVILATNLVKTTLVALFILVIVRRLITRPLERMAAYARRLTPDRLDEPLVLDRPGHDKVTDELDYLASSLNAMREDLRASYGRLRASETRYRGLFADSPVALWELDLSAVKRALDGLPCRSADELDACLRDDPDLLVMLERSVRVLAVNQATLRLFEAHRRSELVRALADGLGAGLRTATRDMLRTLWLGRLHGHCEAVIETLSGNSRHVFARWSILPGAERTFGRAIVSLLDVTDSVTAREDLQRTIAELARSNTELERFAYVASHDLREPLRSIVSYSQLLERRHPEALGDEGAEFLGYIVRGAKRMDALVNDLLSYSRISQRIARFDEVDLAAVVDAVVDGLGGAIRETGAEVAVGPLPRVTGNRIQLIEVFQNLMTNALKYRRPGVPPRIEIGGEPQGNGWRLFVRDNGLGIDPIHFDAIFEVFRRLHGPEEFAGTGMGLAICRRIVRFHGGDIWVESTPGAGSTFYFTIGRQPVGDRPHDEAEATIDDGPAAANDSENATAERVADAR